MGAPQGTSMSSVPTGASAGLDAGANGQIEIKDSVIGPDSTIAAVQLEPLEKTATETTGTASSTSTTKSQGIAGVLDSLADSQPGKSATDMLNQASSEFETLHETCK
jgi:hypothetical protein